MFGIRIRCGREKRVKIEVGVSGFSRKNVSFSGTEVTTGWVRSGKK